MEISDYLQKGDVGFKKPKTKKKRPTRRIAEDSGIETVNDEEKMDVDEKPIIPRARNLDMNFVDDDELQASLARARRAKTLKPKVLTQEEIARKRESLLCLLQFEQSLSFRTVLEERNRNGGANGDTVKEEEDEEQAGLVFDETSEFVQSVQYDPVAVKQVPQERSVKVEEQPQIDVPMKEEDESESEDEPEAGEVKEEDEGAILNALENAINSVEAAESGANVKVENGDDGVGTSAEQTFGQGMAATLNILRQQGVVAAPSADQGERERTQKHRDVWLAEYRTRLALRELERVRAKGEKKDQAQREYENRLREQQEARESLELFKDYKPDVNIVYHDEFGRELTPKEAWKALSHRFHGKGSGKMKTEKRLKKIAEEKKKAAMASGDTPLSMNKAFQMRQEKAGQAHFVLSVGSRG